MQQVLLIEDNPADAYLFEHSIMERGMGDMEITHIESLEELGAMESSIVFDVAMLDMGLPGISGLDAVDYLHEHYTSLPVIVLTGNKDDSVAMEAVRHGVQDYLIKGESSGEIIRRAIRYSIERKRYQDHIVYLQNYDQLTGLMNDTQFRQRIDREIMRKSICDDGLCVLFVDIDHFKHINDAYGSILGDSLLIKVGEMLRFAFEDKYPVGRLAEDTFMMLIPNLSKTNHAADVAEHVLGLFNTTLVLHNEPVPLSVSIGIATYPDCGKDSAQLFSAAESALANIKENGRRHYCFFSETLHEDIRNRMSITSALYTAAENGELSLVYQPKVDLRTGLPNGYEALIRWKHHTLGMVPPDMFIPIAENVGLIRDITAWVVNQVCADYIWFSDMEMSINISARELKDEKLVSHLQGVMAHHDMPANRLALELTETAVMEDAEHAIETMQALRDAGFKLHIDDFGTGYSSLNYLRVLPADTLKIDKSFIMHIHESEEDYKIVRVISDLAHDLGMSVMAEGVETVAHANKLRFCKCETGQGYLYAKPMPLEECLEWLHRSKKERFCF